MIYMLAIVEGEPSLATAIFAFDRSRKRRRKPEGLRLTIHDLWPARYRKCTRVIDGGLDGRRTSDRQYFSLYRLA